MNFLEWSVFAAAVVAVGVLIGLVMHIVERKRPKCLD